MKHSHLIAAAAGAATATTFDLYRFQGLFVIACATITILSLIYASSVKRINYDLYARNEENVEYASAMEALAADYSVEIDKLREMNSKQTRIDCEFEEEVYNVAA